MLYRTVPTPRPSEAGPRRFGPGEGERCLPTESFRLRAPNKTSFWRVALLRDRAEPYGFERPSRRLALQIQVVLGALSRNDSVGKQRSTSPGPKRRGPASPSEGRGVGTVRYSLPLPDEGEACANATCRLVALATGEGVPSTESFRLSFSRVGVAFGAGSDRRRSGAGEAGEEAAFSGTHGGALARRPVEIGRAHV